MALFAADFQRFVADTVVVALDHAFPFFEGLGLLFATGVCARESSNASTGQGLCCSGLDDMYGFLIVEGLLVRRLRLQRAAEYLYRSVTQPLPAKE